MPSNAARAIAGKTSLRLPLLGSSCFFLVQLVLQSLARPCVAKYRTQPQRNALPPTTTTRGEHNQSTRRICRLVDKVPSRRTIARRKLYPARLPACSGLTPSPPPSSRVQNNRTPPASRAHPHPHPPRLNRFCTGPVRQQGAHARSFESAALDE